MKLWLCYANTTDHEPTTLHVAKTEGEAIKKFAETLNEDGIWYASLSAEVIEVVDGYGIEIIE